MAGAFNIRQPQQLAIARAKLPKGPFHIETLYGIPRIRNGLWRFGRGHFSLAPTPTVSDQVTRHAKHIATELLRIIDRWRVAQQTNISLLDDVVGVGDASHDSRDVIAKRWSRLPIELAERLLVIHAADGRDLTLTTNAEKRLIGKAKGRGRRRSVRHHKRHYRPAAGEIDPELILRPVVDLGVTSRETHSHGEASVLVERPRHVAERFALVGANIGGPWQRRRLLDAPDGSRGLS